MHSSMVSPEQFPEYLSTVNLGGKVKFRENSRLKKQVKTYLINVFGYRCSVCSQVNKNDTTIEHIIEKSQDTTCMNSKSNLVLACSVCNSKRKSRRKVMSAYELNSESQRIRTSTFFDIDKDGTIMACKRLPIGVLIRVTQTIDAYSKGINRDEIKKFRLSKVTEYKLDKKFILDDYNKLIKNEFEYDHPNIIPFLLIDYLSKENYCTEAEVIEKKYRERGQE